MSKWNHPSNHYPEKHSHTEQLPSRSFFWCTCQSSYFLSSMLICSQLVGFHSYALANSVTHTLEVAVLWMTSMPSHVGTYKLVCFGHKVSHRLMYRSYRCAAIQRPLEDLRLEAGTVCDGNGLNYSVLFYTFG